MTNIEGFLNEIAILKAVDHPNVQKYYECYEDEYNYYIVTEFCQGGEIIGQILQEKGIDENKASQIIKQVFSALTYCHTRKIIHRDIKIENVLLKDKSSSNLFIKVIDFGVSVKRQKEEKLTQSIGTPYYMAPEVFSGEYTEKCDMWSCGVLLYVLISGAPPFQGSDLDDLQDNILREDLTFD